MELQQLYYFTYALLHWIKYVCVLPSMSMFDLYTHLGHSTRSVAKAIIQELEKEGLVRKIEGRDSESDKWEWVRE